ncbi:MAG: hypothetical protein ACTSW1_15415 [Candidatus Hodarchaeales archaeon]
MIEEFLRDIKDSSDFFTKMDAMYTSSNRRYIRHLKCIFLELSHDFTNQKHNILSKTLANDGDIKFKFKILDDSLIRIHFHRLIRFGKKIDSNTLLYIINDNYAAIFFSRELDSGKLLQRNLLRKMYPFWRRIVLTKRILNTLIQIAKKDSVSSIDRQPVYQQWEEKRKKWRYASLKIPLRPYELNVRVADDGTIGLQFGSIRDLLQLFMEAIVTEGGKSDLDYTLEPMNYSDFGIPKGEAIHMVFSEAFSQAELYELTNSFSQDLEERFLITTLHSGNPFLQLNIMEPITGSVFLFMAIEDEIRIIPTSKYNISSLKALVESLFSSTGFPDKIEKIKV